MKINQYYCYCLLRKPPKQLELMTEAGVSNLSTKFHFVWVFLVLPTTRFSIVLPGFTLTRGFQLQGETGDAKNCFTEEILRCAVFSRSTCVYQPGILYFGPFFDFLFFLYLCFSVFSGFTEETRCCAVFSRSTRVYQSRIPMEVESVRFSCISVELIGIAVK